MYRNLGRMLVTGSVTAVMLVVVGALGAGMPRAEDGHFVQTNLVSDIPGLATITDPQLHNPWGVSHSLTSPFWVSNQGTNTATLYAVTDETTVSKININAPAGFVKIPTTGAGPQGPTGQVNNTNTSSFPVNGGGDGKSAHFIFANLNDFGLGHGSDGLYPGHDPRSGLHRAGDQRRTDAPICRR